MSTGDDGDDAARADVAFAPTTPGVASSTRGAGGTETSPGRVIAPPTAAGDESMLRAGDAVDRYRIEGYLGRGGMGVVYRARDPDLDRALAIKLVRSRHRGGDRMLREAQAMARLDHPNVVPIFDVGVRGEQIFLVMPFLSGGTLGDWCRQTPRPWHEVVRRYLEAGRGLEAAHRAGIVHRDFKPDNVLIDSNGEVHVADFGLARAQRDDSGEVGEPIVEPSGPLGYALTRAGELLGTPAYMAPEQLDGKSVDAKADQFSFCVALYEGLYGQRPFELPRGGNIVEHRRAIADARVRPAPADRDVPPLIRDALLRGLREDPAARWPTTSALLDQLERGLERRKNLKRVLNVRFVVRIALGVAAIFAVEAIWSRLWRDKDSPTRHAASTSLTAPPGEPFKARPLTFRGDIGLADLSPDGTQVAAIAGNDLVLVPTAAGGELRTLVAKIGDDLEALSWAADGKHVLLTSPIDLERTRLRIVDVTSGAVEDLERAAWARAVISGPREVASVLATERSIRITPLDQNLPSRRCPLTGEIEWVSDIIAAGSALFVVVAHHDQAFTVERTDRNCVAPRAVLDHVPPGEVIVSLDGKQVGIKRSRGEHVVVEWHDVEGGAVADSRPLTAGLGIDDLVGRMPDGNIVAEGARSSWQLVPLVGGDAIGVGSSAAKLVVSPDRTRAAVLDSRDERRALRVVPLAHLDARPAPLAIDILAAAWSPDGAWLAVVHDVGPKVELAAIELATGTWTPLPAGDVSGYSEVTWLDDQRIAYLRADHKSFVAIDRETLATENVLDPAPGWTFELAASPADGTLAVHWERENNGVYIVPPGGAPTMVSPGGRIKLAWSIDGKTLWSVEQNLGIVHRYDTATKKSEQVRQIALDRNSMVTDLVPMPDGSVLVKIDRDTRDLVVLE